jgi:glycosyltransferase involved in cell wall biosynthesis
LSAIPWQALLVQMSGRGGATITPMSTLSDLLGQNALDSRTGEGNQAVRPPHVVYIGASGDIVSSYEHWRSGTDAGHEGGLSYSAGVFDAIRSTGATGLCLSPGPGREPIVDSDMAIENIAPLRTAKGAGFYLAWFSYSMRLVRRILRERPDMLFLSDRVIFFPFLLPLRLRGTRIVHVFHVAPWNAFKAPAVARRILLTIEFFAMRRLSYGALGLYGRVADQLRRKLSRHGVRVDHFLPEWPVEDFKAVPPGDHAAEPFRIFFVGRVEAAKGVFDLLEAFQQVASRCDRDVRLDYFGDGSALSLLGKIVAERKLGDRVTLHGQCHASVVRAHLAQSHLVVVPSRTDFVEGLNKVVIEGLLAGRPVVSSAVCPAAEMMAGAAILVTPDDPDSYAAAITRLATDPQAYANAVVRAGELAGWLDAHRRPLGQCVRELIAEKADAR